MGDIIYPHCLLDLEVEEVRDIIHNTFAFSAGFLERDIPVLLDEIQSKANGKTISDRTIKSAVEAANDFMGDLEDWFNEKLADDKWRYTRHRAKTYLSALNETSSLVFAHETEGRTIVISKPLFHAVAQTCEMIFDYSITKSEQMKHTLKKSDDYHRQKILSIKEKRSLRYYFIKVLEEYGANSKQLIKNLYFLKGSALSNAVNATNNLPSF